MPYDTGEMAITRSPELLLEIPILYVPGQQRRRHDVTDNATNDSSQLSTAAPRRRPTSRSTLRGQQNQETIRGL
jgi:hypothetical protein